MLVGTLAVDQLQNSIVRVLQPYLHARAPISAHSHTHTHLCVCGCVCVDVFVCVCTCMCVCMCVCVCVCVCCVPLSLSLSLCISTNLRRRRNSARVIKSGRVSRVMPIILYLASSFVVCSSDRDRRGCPARCLLYYTCTNTHTHKHTHTI